MFRKTTNVLINISYAPKVNKTQNSIDEIICPWFGKRCLDNNFVNKQMQTKYLNTRFFQDPTNNNIMLY